MNLKLNEIIAALKGASNRLINIEELSEQEVRLLHDKYRTLAGRTDAEVVRKASHSIEEED